MKKNARNINYDHLQNEMNENQVNSQFQQQNETGTRINNQENFIHAHRGDKILSEKGFQMNIQNDNFFSVPDFNFESPNSQQNSLINSSEKNRKENPEYEGIFNVDEAKKKAHRNDKNSNVSKFLMKNFIQKAFTRKDRVFFIHDEEDMSKEIFGFVDGEKKKYKNTKNWNNNIEALKKIFGLHPKSKNPKLRSFLLRKHLASCIREHLIDQVLKNNQIKPMKRCYIHSLLTQIFRCGSIELMQRTQIV